VASPSQFGTLAATAACSVHFDACSACLQAPDGECQVGFPNPGPRKTESAPSTFGATKPSLKVTPLFAAGAGGLIEGNPYRPIEEGSRSWVRVDSSPQAFIRLRLRRLGPQPFKLALMGSDTSTDCLSEPDLRRRICMLFNGNSCKDSYYLKSWSLFFVVGKSP
jgi:hypothetical protein